MMHNEHNKSKLFTRGGQITFNNLRMMAQINKQLINWFIFITLICILCSIESIAPTDSIKASYYNGLSWLMSHIGMGHHVLDINWHGKTITTDPISIQQDPFFDRQWVLFKNGLRQSLYIGLAVAAVIISALSYWLITCGRKQAQSRYVRGAKLASPKQVTKAIVKFGASNIVICKIPMVKDFEIKHTLIHGTTGSGKGQTFCQFLEQIRKRGDSAIVFDKGCVFTSLFLSEGQDTILNPFDKRSANWDLWAEARTEPDFENIAESLIPMHGESDPYWVDAARTVFSSVAFKMRDDADRSMHKLLQLILTAELDVLGEYLKGTQAATLVSDKIEKTAISIRSVISTYLKSLRFLQGLEGKSFSIRNWIQSIADSPSGHILFISSNAEHHATLRPLISMWLSMASISLLSLEENYTRRIWFVCDELPSLHKLPQLAETIAEVRKFGGCFILGMQSLSQLQKVYGRASATEMFDLLNTRFFFRSPSADMAQIISKEIGSQDVEQSTESYSYGASKVRDGISIGTQRISRALVSPAEIMDMPDLTAYLRVPAPVPVVNIKMHYIQRDKVAPGFILRESMTANQSVTEAQSESKHEERPQRAEEITEPPKDMQDINDLQKQEENINSDKFMGTGGVVF